MTISQRGGLSEIHLFVSATVALFLCLLPDPTAAADQTVVINEIMWDGTEYVELFNTTDQDISLDTWILQRKRGTAAPEKIVQFSSSDIIKSKSYFLLEKQEDATSISSNKTSSALTLLNSGEQLLLINKDSTVIDQANGSGMWWAGENTETGVAMERNTEITDGTLVTSWHSSSGSDGGRSGTPGTANSTPPENHAPQAVAGADIKAGVGETISFSAEDSSDADADTLTYAWDFGDGATAKTKEASHSFATAKTYEVTLVVSDGQTSDSDALTVTVSTPSYADTLKINEFLPDPDGSDTTAEFIELYNSGGVAVDLSGWQLDDADGGSTPYTIPTGTSMRAGAYLAFFRSETKIALNNEGDSVRLLAPDKTVKASAIYGKEGSEGQSFNNEDGTYTLSTTPTPGQPNTITAKASEEEQIEGSSDSEETTTSTTKSSKAKGRVAGQAIKTVEVGDIRSEEKDTWVQTEGIVSVPVGVIGKNIFYIAGSGIQVAVPEGDYAALTVGKKVHLTGQVSSYFGEARLKVTNASDIVAGSETQPPEPHQIETGEIGEDTEGWLVTVFGKVTQTSGSTFYIDDGSGEAKVYIKDTTGITKPKMKKDTEVTITGIVSRTTSAYRLLPRFQEDVRLGRVAGLTHFPATGHNPFRYEQFQTYCSAGWWQWYVQAFTNAFTAAFR